MCYIFCILNIIVVNNKNKYYIMMFKNAEGRGESDWLAAVKDPGSSSRGPRLDSQHLHSNSQLSFTPFQENQ